VPNGKDHFLLPETFVINPRIKPKSPIISQKINIRINPVKYLGCLASVLIPIAPTCPIARPELKQAIPVVNPEEKCTNPEYKEYPSFILTIDEFIPYCFQK
jgi:hypothetical protein